MKSTKKVQWKLRVLRVFVVNKNIRRLLSAYLKQLQRQHDGVFAAVFGGVIAFPDAYLVKAYIFIKRNGHRIGGPDF